MELFLFYQTFAEKKERTPQKPVRCIAAIPTLLVSAERPRLCVKSGRKTCGEKPFAALLCV